MRFIALSLLLMFSLYTAAFADQFEDGKTACINFDYPTAIRLLTPLAEQGDTEAQWRLAESYWRQQNDADYLKWLQKSADGGDPEGEHQLGLKLGFNTEAGLKWQKKAAREGSIDAQEDLAWRYDGNSGNEQGAKAEYWFQMAAEHGDARAQKELGLMYHSGRGVRRDEEKAYYWFSLCCQEGQAFTPFKLTPGQMDIIKEHVDKEKLPDYVPVTHCYYSMDEWSHLPTTTVDRRAEEWDIRPEREPPLPHRDVVKRNTIAPPDAKP